MITETGYEETEFTSTVNGDGPEAAFNCLCSCTCACPCLCICCIVAKANVLTGISSTIGQTNSAIWGSALSLGNWD